MSGIVGDEMEYNNLTKKLLSDGYTVDEHPGFVKVNESRFSDNDPLSNLAGGFEYKRWYSDKIVYKTGCGKFVMGENVINNMGYMGVEWCHENDNPVIRCPYDKSECPANDERFRFQCWCVCHSTNEPYNYDNSIEKADKECKNEMERKYQEYSDLHKGRVCRNHMFYNERTRTWFLDYKPSRCAEICYSKNKFCPILGRQLSKKRGNVYYDLKKSGILQQRENQLSLFDGEQWIHITKGIRYFDKPVSMDICEAFIKVEKNEIKRNYDINHSWEKLMDKTVDWEIINIRAEAKPSRDLMQDLEDIKNGILLSFDEDMRRNEAEHKKEKRKLAKQKKIDRLEKKLLEVGYWNMEPFEPDRKHADKWLGMKRIYELEEIRKQKLKEKQEMPVQMSLFDFIKE